MRQRGVARPSARGGRKRDEIVATDCVGLGLIDLEQLVDGNAAAIPGEIAVRAACADVKTDA